MIMKKLALALTTCFTLPLALFGSCCSAIPDGPAFGVSHAWPSSINLDICTGFREDRFEWSIAGIDDFPNVLSELKWKELRMVEVSGYASYVSPCNYAIRFSGDYGFIYHGKNIDSDYLQDDEHGLFSRSINNAGKGFVFDVEGAVGYRVISTCSRFVAILLGGYGYHDQHLHIYDGRQVFSPFLSELGPISGLNSRYRTRWYGPWIGLDFNTHVECCAYLFGSMEWHFLNYRGEGHWNLREDIGPFFHRAWGQGYVGVLGANWEIWGNWSIGVVGTYRHFWTHHGREKLIVNDPIFGEIEVHTRFNHASWVVGTLSGLITYRF